MIQILIIIAITIVLIYGIYSYYNYKNPYKDEIVKEGPYLEDNVRVGTWVRYKRTYKNGKIVFHEEEYY